MNRYLPTSVLLLTIAAGSVSAQGITPNAAGTTYGTLSGATFNGTAVSSGIPNDHVTQIGDLSTVLIGLSATQRFSSPTVTDNGAGTYFATTGFSTAPASLWNFDFFIGGALDGNYHYQLRYDFDPATGTPKADLGSYGLNAQFVGDVTSLIGQVSNSENLSFSFLTNSGSEGSATLPIFGSVAIGEQTPPPASPAYDPTVPGEYSFELDQLNIDGAIVQHVSINVDVVGTPEPATFALMGTGLLGLVGVARRRRNA